jgi:hypothetical protein
LEIATLIFDKLYGEHCIVSTITVTVTVTIKNSPIICYKMATLLEKLITFWNILYGIKKAIFMDTI